MDGSTIGLRIVHIIAGVLWVGGAALFFFYIEPTINKLGPDAEKFVGEMIERRKVPVYFITVSTVTVLAGVILYHRLAGRRTPNPSHAGEAQRHRRGDEGRRWPALRRARRPHGGHPGAAAFSGRDRPPPPRVHRRGDGQRSISRLAASAP